MEDQSNFFADQRIFRGYQSNNNGIGKGCENRKTQPPISRSMPRRQTLAMIAEKSIPPAPVHAAPESSRWAERPWPDP
jgi:hypothetical protein